MAATRGKTSGERNGAVEFVRFLFSIIICVLHFRDDAVLGDRPIAFWGGYLAVDFFFVLSGFLMMRHFSDEKAEGAENSDIGYKWRIYRAYVIGRIKALYPLYLFGLLTLVAARFVLQHWTVRMVFVDGFYEFFMLQETGIGQLFLDDQLWFVSALFLASCIVAYLLIFHRQLYLNFLAPIFAVVIPTVFYRLYGNWVTHGAWGTIRAIGMLSLGCLTYQLYLRLDRSGIKRSLWMTLLECSCLALVLYVMWGARSDYYDFFIIPFWGVLTLLLFLKQGWLSNALDNRLSRCLGGISYAIYVCQHVILVILTVKPLTLPDILSPMQAWCIRLAAFIMLTILLAAMAEPLCQKLTKVVCAYIEKINQAGMQSD